MRIGYIAKHDSGGNDDEGAITFALEALGHTVKRLAENEGHHAPMLDVDFILFHKWNGRHVLPTLKVPKVFWYFDLVDFPDPLIRGRCEARKAWMHTTLPHVDLGFCTDGDWVANDKSGKLVWLTQGADKRVIGTGNVVHAPIPLLFTGIRRGGAKRASFVADMEEKYGTGFDHVEKGSYGEALKQLIARAIICVAPDGPITDRYWSNRVYNTLGFGGFLIHPWCERLREHYLGGEEILFYKSREHLHELIKTYWPLNCERAKIARAGLERTKSEHTYRHRCETLVRVVQQRLF